MKTKHPNFFLGIISFVLFIIGIFMKGNSYQSGNIVIIISVILGGIHWIWSIIDVLGNNNLRGQAKVLWTILVTGVPPLGGVIYYLMGTRQIKM